MAEHIIDTVYFSCVALLASMAFVGTLIRLWRIYVLGHFPKERPKWLKRPLKEVFRHGR